MAIRFVCQTGILISCVLIMLLLMSAEAFARPDIMLKWQQRYPESLAGDRGCQLCHQSDQGGDGWNRYGFDIRFFFIDVFQSTSIELAFEVVESLNSDNDDNEISNLDEINQNLDPGWKRGPRNRIFFKDGTILNGLYPPFLVDGDEEDIDICFPIRTSSEVTALICL